ncbi:DUF3375 domain-containing protein [Arthrobacter methylotrophus]|uniref:DUF3375 domain-containing protein n=1 Tax=Arthrobacter methylotrophus TaxID=121291 RepID=A0ABV5UTI6_9MICC
MSILRPALEASRLQESDPAWAMLRARNAPVAISILDKHLGGEARRVAAPVLFERIEDDLEELRSHGFELPQTAQQYCAEWRSSGILIRRAAEDAREETLELSQGALTAIRFASQLSAPRASVTESRLATVIERLRALARDTDPDISSRLAGLQAERARLDAQIERVAAGDVDIPAPEHAAERLRDVLALVDEVPADFARVRSDFERLNRDLREKLIDQEGSRGAVLDDIFLGVDLLASSDAGRSFTGFYSLLLDPERGIEFEESIQDVLGRDFMDTVTVQQAKSLRRILPTLQDRSSEIHGVMTAFSRSLRRFVQSQEFLEDRVINHELRSALRLALDISESVKPYAKTALALNLSSAPLDSVAALSLHNPGDFEASEHVVTHDPEPVDIEQLRELARASDVDMEELRGSVNAALAALSAATIAEVLAVRPATQGVASVVGLLVLADEHASPLIGREDVVWESSSGTARRGTVGRYLFTEPIGARPVRRTAP